MNFAVHPLRKAIAEGEGVSLDFKKTISSAQKIAKTLVAFANTEGGRLLIGVRDNGSICGCEPQEELHMIELAADFYCSPPVPFTSDVLLYKDQYVLEITVPNSHTKPHSAKGEDNKWWVYIRAKDKTVLASKVVVDVLRRENLDDEPTIIQYTTKERALLEYLEHNERIYLKDYCALINISRRRAMRILVNLVSAGIIRVHHTEQREFYTLS